MIVAIVFPLQSWILAGKYWKLSEQISFASNPYKRDFNKNYVGTIDTCMLINIVLWPILATPLYITMEFTERG
jgi:hypothetical protein